MIPLLLIAFCCNSPTSDGDTAILGSDSPLSNQVDKIEQQGTSGALFYEEHWVFDHYGYRERKLVGVWPDDYSQARLSELYSRWGFRGVLVDANTYGTAISVGFSPSSMMVAVNSSNYENVVQNYTARAYYSGEVTDHPCYGSPPYSYTQLVTMGSFIRSFNRKFIIDGYRRCQHFIDAGRNAADYVMFSSYKHWFDVDPFGSECWTWISEDQQSSWDDMQSVFGSRFMSTWISGWVSTSTCGVASDYDGDEYQELTTHARDLRLQEIWFFIGCGTTADELMNFTDWVWRTGWLRKFERLTYNIYECICSNDCNNPPPGPCWRQVGTKETTTLREVYP
jgi:hypothetical protein